MNSLDHKFKEKIQQEINDRFLETQSLLVLPATNEMSTNLHEIGVLRGYIKACKEFYDVCDDIMKELTEPEKR